MIKVVIIDDEQVIIRGLVEKIDWTSLGCTVCGTALNGLEGERLIDDIQPDIIISDIVMPGKTGLELAEYAKRRSPKSLIILLTGYSEFEYAKQALDFGVFCYLLKPTDKSEVVAALKKAIRQIQLQHEESNTKEHMQRTINQSIPVLKTALLYDMLFGTEPAVALSRIEQMGIEIGGSAVVVFAFSEHHTTRSLDTGKQLLMFAAKNIIDETFQNHQVNVSILEKEDRSFLIIPKMDASLPVAIIQRRLQSIARDALDSLVMYLQMGFVVGIGGKFARPSELANSLSTAYRALEEVFFHDYERIMSYDDAMGSKSMVKTFRSNHLSQETLLQHIETKETEAALSALSSLLEQIKAMRSRKFADHFAMELLINMASILKKWGCEHALTYTATQFYECTTFQQFASRVKDVVLEVIRALRDLPVGWVERAIRMIHLDYADPNLSLQSVSDQLGISPSHLSRSFKKETGENFNAYVTKVRLEQARLLIETTEAKTKDIAEKVGFTDFRYFGQLFKKWFHVSPTSYKRKR